MTGKHFVDTNLLVYARDDSEPAKRDRAREVMHRLWTSGSGRLSHQVLHEFYVTVTRKLKPGLTRDEAREEVRDLLSWNPVPISASLYECAWEIEERWNLSWWDSLIAASARLAGCSILLSEDMQDGLDLGGLRIVNPFSPQFDFSFLD
jgi:predicted nucleic acid-binding protein